MESLLLVLQAALLLISCALSWYFRDINTTVALVVLGVTLFGLLFHLFIVVEGVVSLSFPYQTPVAHILWHIPHILGVLRSVIFPIIEGFRCYHAFTDIANEYQKGKFPSLVVMLPVAILLLPIPPAIDFLLTMKHTISGSIESVRLHLQLEQQIALLDLYCISWTLQILLDGPVHLSALNCL